MKAHLLSVAFVTIAANIPLQGTHAQDKSEAAALPEFSRELTPEVRSVLEGGGHEARLLRNYLNYANALRAGGDALDIMVLPDVKLNDLEPFGFVGLEGLKAFRQRQNTSMSYERSVVRAVSFPTPEITDVELCTERTDVATGAKLTFVVYARDRWVDDKVAERWHRREELPTGSDCGPGDSSTSSAARQ